MHDNYHVKYFAIDLIWLLGEFYFNCQTKIITNTHLMHGW